MNASISLHLIVKDEVEQVIELINSSLGFVDHTFITVSDVKAYNELKEEENEFVKVDYRKWNDRFDEARQHNWNLGKDYDYSMWLDADDTFDFTQLSNIIENSTTDCIFLPYDFDHDDKGNVIVRLWRERIIKRTSPFFWRGWVHENLICEEPFTHERVFTPVTHHNSEAHKKSSLKRNHKILEKAYDETNDPRYIHYLGISYFSIKDWQNAIRVLEEYVQVGGWTEEIYRSLIKISESHFMLGNIDLAILSALKAVGIENKLPQAFDLLCHYEYEDGNFESAILYGNDALSRPDPEEGSIWDPTARDRTMLTMALCHFELKDYKNAYELISKVRAIDTSDVINEFKDKAELEVFQQLLPGLKKFYDKPSSLWINMKDEYKFDSKIREFRNSVVEPHIWGEKTVVFFCGKGYEEWGPHTTKKGMGGSEEAVLYLSKELVKLGFQVFVYGEMDEEMVVDNVVWVPWNRFDIRDIFDILILWRQPQLAPQLKARQIFIDMHDVFPESVVAPHSNATYLFKSEYHKSLYPKIKKSFVIPNGVLASQFNDVIPKKDNSVIYGSAYYRGLECLLTNWLEIRKRVPDATLNIYYGWESWVKAEGKNEFYKRMCRKIEELKEHGVTEHGRVSHEELAEHYLESKVWAYPTEFTETFCITAVKANLAGCKVVTTDVAALKETAGPQATIIETDSMYSDQYAQKMFVDAVVKALEGGEDSIEQRKWAQRFDWKNVAKQWEEVING